MGLVKQISLHISKIFT